MIVTRTEKHLICKSHIAWKEIDNLTFYSKNLFNHANYIIRHTMFETEKILTYNQVFNLCKDSDEYKQMGSNVGQATLRMLDKAWKSFAMSTKKYYENPKIFLGKPKIPKYLNKNGRFVCALDNNKVGIKDGKIYFKWKRMKYLNGIFTTKISPFAKIMQCRFVPKGHGYSLELIYQIDVPDYINESKNIASIDLGVENFVTMVNNIGIKPIVIKGGIIKSINQYYNKKKAKMQSQIKVCNNLNWSKQLQRLTDKRENKLEYEMHNVSRKIVDWCVLYNIDTLVIGKNKEWKQNNLGMQNFTYIPFNKFENMLQYKCENNGIRCIFTDESYTSGTSFIDGEYPDKELYDKQRRIYRGLFISNDGKFINADVNGAYQIMKKAFPNAFADGIEGVGLHPMVLKYHKG